MHYSEGLDTTGVSDLASARGHEGKRTNQGSHLIYITEKPVHQHAQNTTFGLFATASLFRFTGWFYTHLFYSSKMRCIIFNEPW